MSDGSDYTLVGTGYSEPITQALSRVAIERVISVPFRIDSDGSVTAIEGRYNMVRQSLVTLIMTFLGERVMLPLYGSTIYEYLWEHQDESIIGVLLEEIRDLIRENFPQVNIINLGIEPPTQQNEDAALIISLDFSYDDRIDHLVLNTSLVLLEN